MKKKEIYQPPVCEPVYFEVEQEIMGGSSATSTAMTISLVEIGDDQIEDGGTL